MSTAPSRFLLMTSLLLVWLGLWSCAHCGWANIDVATLPGKERFPDTGGIVLQHLYKVRFFSSTTGMPLSEETSYWSYRLLRENGRHGLDTALLYKATFGEVVDYRVKTTTPEGKVQVFSSADADDLPSFKSWVLYSDNRVRSVDVSHVPVGTVVEVKTTVRYTQPNFFQHSHGFGDLHPVLYSRFDVELPNHWKVEHHKQELNSFTPASPKKTVKGDLTLYTWEKKDIAPFKREQMAPPLQQQVPRINVRLSSWQEQGQTIQGFKDVRELSAGLYKMINEKSRVTPEIESLGREIVNTQETQEPHKIARQIYEWSRDKVSYCAIEIGMGGWVPYAASQVAQLRYGDCKDKANLAKSLLASRGIPSRLALVYSHDGLPRVIGHPVIASNFNHMILIIDLPSGSIIADPTARTTPFGELPFSLHGAPLLPLTKEGALPLIVPITDAEKNSKEITLDIVIDTADNARGHFAATFSGGMATFPRFRVLHAEDIGKKVTELVGLQRTEYSNIDCLNLEPQSPEMLLKLEGDFEKRRFLSRSGSTRVLDVNSFVRSFGWSLQNKERESPLVLQGKFRLMGRISFTLPKHLIADSIPEPVELNCAHASYRQKWQQQSGVLTLEKELMVKSNVVAPEEYELFRKFSHNVLTAESRAIVLVSR